MCKAHKVNSRTYPNDVIARMPYMQKANYEELLQMLPHKWKEIKNDGDTTIDGCLPGKEIQPFFIVYFIGCLHSISYRKQEIKLFGSQ